MTKHESQKRRNLRFVCPKCGSGWLCARNQVEIEIEDVSEDGCFGFGSTLEEMIMDFYCSDCGYILEFGDEETLAEWLMTHCNQDQTDTGLSEDRPSEVPPSGGDK
jgi:predicted RNA-binding Zn-ribbon protein involved in translation (DUF1610 family)